MVAYTEIPPRHPALIPFVRFHWRLTAPFPLGSQLIVPDGSPELIFHFGDRFVFEGSVQPRAFVFGQIEQAIRLEHQGSRADVLGVRFQPAGLAAFTRVPQHELRGRMVTCAELWNEDPEFEAGADRVDAVEAFLIARLRRPVADLRSFAVGERQRRRHYLDQIGLSPKRLERIRRLQLAMRLLTRRDDSLAHAAAAAGYFDQAHFTKDFRAFTGQSPAQYLRGQQHELSDLFVSAGA